MTAGARASPAHPGVLGPGIAVLLVIAGLLGLGKWQLDRKVWKEDLIHTLEERLAAAPTELPPPARWSASTASQMCSSCTTGQFPEPAMIQWFGYAAAVRA